MAARLLFETLDRCLREPSESEIFEVHVIWNGDQWTRCIDPVNSREEIAHPLKEFVKLRRLAKIDCPSQSQPQDGPILGAHPVQFLPEQAKRLVRVEFVFDLRKDPCGNPDRLDVDLVMVQIDDEHVTGICFVERGRLWSPRVPDAS